MVKKLMILSIRLYQKYLSPMKRTKCPYIPTCSQYGLEAFWPHGGSCGAILFLTEVTILCRKKFADISAKQNNLFS